MTPLARLLWRPRIEGAEYFPKEGPCFVYGNHSNRWDPFILNCFTSWLEPTAGVMTKEFFRGRLLGSVFRSIGIVPASKRLAEPFLVRQVLELLREKRSVVIFPEGGTRWDGSPLPWMPSTVKLFVRAGVPIHAVRIHGSYLSFPRWADYPRPSKVVVEALPPQTFDRNDDVADVTKRLQDFVNMDESTQTRADCIPVRAFRPAAGVHRLLYRDPFDDSGPLYSPDGYTVRNVSGSQIFTMLPDSTLRRERDGCLFNTAELYSQILRLPLEQAGVAEFDHVLVADRVVVHKEREFPQLRELGSRTVRLYRDHIEIGDGADAQTIGLEDLLYCDIERNYKLQLYLRDSTESMIQFSFTGGGSALQWKDAISVLRPQAVGFDAGVTEEGGQARDRMD